MIGELVDRFVSVFSPAAAARRTHARGVYQDAVSRSYEAGRTSRLNGNWRTPNTSADLELSQSADTIRGRARALVRDNAYARGAVRSLVRNVVGCGIRPQARTTAGENADKRIEAIWNRWQKHADISGRLSFYEIQRLAYAEKIEAGESLIRFVRTTNRSRVLPLALELIEADRFATDHFIRGFNPDTGNEVRRGVEINAAGEPVTYWLYSSHPNSLNSWRHEAKPYPASQFLHLFTQDRIGQTRGVSDFAPVLNWMRTLGLYVENELQSSAIASCFTAVVKSMGGPADGGLLPTVNEDSTDTNGNTFEHIEPGMVARLLPGEDVTTINPGRSHSEAQAWIELMLRSIAVGMGLSYERLSRDYSKTNYSSNRASDLEDRREFRPLQDWLITHLCEPVWKRFIEAGVESGRPEFPSAEMYLSDMDGWNSHIWQSPGWEWVDPVKEQKASAEAINANLSTLTDELGKRGKDLREVVETRARENALLQSVGLSMSEETPEPAGMTDGT